MGAMMELMKSGQMDSWMAARKAEFEALWATKYSRCQ
jgi:hypothetical protein